MKIINFNGLSKRLKAIFSVIYAVNIAIIVIWVINFCFMDAYNANAMDLSSYVAKPRISEFETICKATNGENCDVIYHLCQKESYGCTKYPRPGKNKNGSSDFSWMQVNEVNILEYNKNATKAQKKDMIGIDCVYDLSCVARWANEQIKKGNGHIWSTWKSI